MVNRVPFFPCHLDPTLSLSFRAEREISLVAELEISPGVEMTKGKDWLSAEGCRECVPFVIPFILSFRSFCHSVPFVIPTHGKNLPRCRTRDFSWGRNDNTVVRSCGAFILCLGRGFSRWTRRSRSPEFFHLASTVGVLRQGSGQTAPSTVDHTQRRKSGFISDVRLLRPDYFF